MQNVGAPREGAAGEQAVDEKEQLMEQLLASQRAHEQAEERASQLV